MDINQDSKFKYFIKSKPRKYNTIKKYTRDIQLYSQSTGKTPTELIQEARKEQIKIPWMDERSLPGYFDDFIEFLQER